MRCRRAILLAIVFGIVPFFPARAEQPPSRLKSFLQKHCLACHGAKKQKGDHRFDTLGADLSDNRTLVLWQDMVDQLNLGEMPPKKKPRPDVKELAAVVDFLSARLKAAYTQQRSTGGQTVIRRLNRFELRNTLRDLLYLKGPEFRPGNVAKLVDNNGNGRVAQTSSDPVRNFPADEEEDGFDNIGNRLVMSDFLLKLTLAAAEESLRAATHTEKKPTVKTRRFAGHIRTQGPRGLEVYSRELNPDFDTIFQRYLGPGASTASSGRVGPVPALRRGVGTSARYRITIEASGHNQKHPWGELLKTNQNEPFLLGLHIANASSGGLHEGNARTIPLVQWSLPGDGKKRSFSFETWIDKTWIPWLGWENGPYDRRVRDEHLVKKYVPQAYKKRPDRKKVSKEVYNAWPKEMAMALLKGGYKGPSVRIYSLTLEPLIDAWPPKSHRLLYGTGPVDKANVESLMLSFAQRAFRRPVKSSEIARYATLVRKQRAAGRSPLEAMQAGYAAILSSPRFLYHKEKTGRLNNYEIASRLSYFLWSSMPDEKLMALAKAGKLTNAAVVQQEVDRLLDDPKAAAFTRHFTERWLRLDKLGGMPPERGGPFRFYWDRKLEPQMVAQTAAFFADLVKTNGNIRNFIDSDYTFLNEMVAFNLYGRNDVWGARFRKVPLKDPRRGGIFTQPSVMTATANGVDTSPVVRGVWVLENVLGTPPSPPPPDVEPLAPDLRAAKTIREQLEMHRKNDACNSCHRKIDPMGFAMENFDPVGRWRDKYPKAKNKIDASATLSTGRKMADIIEFKKMLMGRKKLVTRCLTEKLLTYSSGRILEPADRGKVDRIVSKLDSKGDGLRDLIKLVVQSDVFLTK